MPTPSHTTAPAGFAAALSDMGKACDTLAPLARESREASAAHGGILAAVAELIANAGPVGGVKMSRAMDAATRAGFEVEFYPGSIRVSRNASAAGQTL